MGTSHKIGFLLTLSVLYSGLTSSFTATRCGVSVALLGSKGDLARRYIWPALFENQVQLRTLTDEKCLEYRLLMFGGSRSEFTDREAALSHLMANIKCSDKHDNRSNGSCSQLERDFVDSVTFVKVKTDNDYKNLAQRISQEFADNNITEKGRIIYLAIPPSAYVSTVEYIKSYLRPSEESTWLRVVLEKPFGHNLSSAVDLTREVSRYLEESEVYRIDHYLGKFGVRQIPRFLLINSEELGSVWNKGGIEFIEIAMEEALDIRGRSHFYDWNGVIRDVHQNHLTEILVLFLMDPNTPSSKYQSEKIKVLSKLYSPGLHHTVLGQYSNYQDHLAEDGIAEASNTPTYATVALFSKDQKWRGVPFLLTSGKQLGQRRAFVRVIFKNILFLDWSRKTGCLPEIKFLIQQGGMRPGLLISDHFSRLGLKHDDTFAKWTERPYSDPISSCAFTYFEPEGDISTNSYESLVGAVLRGKKEDFVDSESLLESWRVWSSLLEEIHLTKPHPIRYSPDSLEGLQYSIHGTKLVTKSQVKKVESKVFPDMVKLPAIANFTENEFFGHKAVVSNKYELSRSLAKSLHKSAVESVRTHGSFHMALPGGSSPLLLLDTLSLDYRYLFPWEHTHVWQTDERCVPPTSQDSNLHQLSQDLLSNLPLHFQNIHPMPVDLQQGLCAYGDEGASLYERQLIEYAREGRLDYVLLGVGGDGHIASLFHPADVLKMPRGDKLVETIELVDSYSVRSKRRMTLTMTTLLEARRIDLILTGESKKDILKRVQRCLMNTSESGCKDLPVMKLILAVKEKQLTFYIDSQLM